MGLRAELKGGRSLVAGVGLPALSEHPGSTPRRSAPALVSCIRVGLC